MTASKDGLGIPSGRKIEPISLIVALGLFGFIGWWVVSVNQAKIEAALAGQEGSIVIDEGATEDLVVTISPARRAEGATVRIDDRPVAHPIGASPGELVVDVGHLELGRHRVEVRVPRPTWFAATLVVDIEVR